MELDTLDILLFSDEKTLLATRLLSGRVLNEFFLLLAGTKGRPAIESDMPCVHQLPELVAELQEPLQCGTEEAADAAGDVDGQGACQKVK